MVDDDAQENEKLVQFRRRQEGSPDNRSYRGRKQPPQVKPRTPTHGFVPGMQLVCRIVKKEPGGYAVSTLKGNYSAFLPSFGDLKEGDEVLAYYVGTLDHNILLEERFPQRTKPKEQVEMPFSVVDGGANDDVADENEPNGHDSNGGYADKNDATGNDANDGGATLLDSSDHVGSNNKVISLMRARESSDAPEEPSDE